MPPDKCHCPLLSINHQWFGKWLVSARQHDVNGANNHPGRYIWVHGVAKSQRVYTLRSPLYLQIMSLNICVLHRWLYLSLILMIVNRVNLRKGSNTAHLHVGKQLITLHSETNQHHTGFLTSPGEAITLPDGGFLLYKLLVGKRNKVIPQARCYIVISRDKLCIILCWCNTVHVGICFLVLRITLLNFMLISRISNELNI